MPRLDVPRGPAGHGLVLALALCGCAGSRAAGPPERPAASGAAPTKQRVDPRPPGRFTDPLRLAKLWLAIPELRRIASKVLVDDGVPGLAAALVIDDRVVWSEGFGVRDLESRTPVTTQSVFKIGSITKPIVALAVLRLRDAGKIDLDARAAEYVPEIAGVSVPRPDLRGPTIRELLTHTSGLPSLGDYSYSTPPHAPSEAEILQSLADYALRQPPGEYMYSNFGYQLLGLVLARTSGEPLREHLSREILAPIGIEHAWWEHADVPADRRTVPYAVERGEVVAKAPWRSGAAAASGALLLDIDGLAALARFELAAYTAGAASTPVHASSVRESHVGLLNGLFAESDGGKLSARANGYGLGWSVHEECTGERVVSHTGGTEGYGASIDLLPDHGVAIVLLGNLKDWPVTDTKRRMLAALRKTGGLVAREPWPAPELLVAARHFAALLAAWDEALFREVWSPHAHSEEDIDEQRRSFAATTAFAGRCAAPQLETTSRPFVGDFVLACEQADVHVRVSATPASGGKILGATVTLVGASPLAELRQSAQAALILAASWDDATFDALFAPALHLASMRHSVRALGDKRGRCQLGDVLEVRPQGATWRATCERGEIEIAVGSDRDDHRITRFDETTKPSDRRRCK